MDSKVWVPRTHKVVLRFITSNSFVSWLIRKLTKSEYSHVDVVTLDGYLGAQYPVGVRIRPFNYAKPSKICTVGIRVTLEEYNRVMEFLYKQVGKPYDTTALLGILADQRDWQEEDSWFCSELIAAAFQQVGRPLVRDDVSRVTPADLYKSPLLKVEESP